MRLSRAFFHVSAGLFLLALAYHFGAANARAQDENSHRIVGVAVAWTTKDLLVVTAGGDVYTRNPLGHGWAGYPRKEVLGGDAKLIGNYWTPAP